MERAGAKRSEERIEDADVLVLVLDGSRPLDDADQDLFSRVRQRPLVIVRNKSDLQAVWQELGPRFGGRSCLAVSATKARGMADLLETIEAAVHPPESETDSVLVTNARHHEGLRCGSHHLEQASALLRQHRELELVAAELQSACGALDDLVGQTGAEDVLDRVFSRFCLGK